MNRSLGILEGKISQTCSQPETGETSFDRRYIFCLCIVALIFASLYVVIALPGAAGDEPAHFENVVYYATHWSMPVLGKPGVSYEGQMGPVYYTLAALTYAPFGGGGTKFGFYVLRYAWLVLIPLTIWLSYKIVRLAFPADRWMALSTATFMGINPSLLAIASSVQNDTLSIVFSLVATIAAIYALQNQRWFAIKGVVVGAIVAAAILTKATAVFFIPALPIYAFLRWRIKSWRFLLPCFITIFLLTCWWFARNFILYGDFTAQAALTKFRYFNNPPPVNLTEWPNLRYWLWVIETYYWLPIQYYRDDFHAPLWVRAVVGLLSLVGLLGTVLRLARSSIKDWFTGRQSAILWFLFSQYLFCFLIYTYSCMRITHFAPRVTFPTILEYAMVIGGVSYLSRRFGLSCGVGLMALAAGLVSANVFVLVKLASIPVFKCNVFLN